MKYKLLNCNKGGLWFHLLIIVFYYVGIDRFSINMHIIMTKISDVVCRTVLRKGGIHRPSTWISWGTEVPIFFFTTNSYDQPPNKNIYLLLWYQEYGQEDITSPVAVPSIKTIFTWKVCITTQAKNMLQFIKVDIFISNLWFIAVFLNKNKCRRSLSWGRCKQLLLHLLGKILASYK